MHSELHEYIIKRLSGGSSPDEIAYEICEKEGLRWADAEALVLEVQNKNQQTIGRRQFPLLLMLGAGLFLLGAAIVFEAAWKLAISLETLSVPQQADAKKISLLFAVIATGPQIILQLVFGTGIMAGSVIGTKRAWYHILYKD